jgi:hypothetical protein
VSGPPERVVLCQSQYGPDRLHRSEGGRPDSVAVLCRARGLHLTADRTLYCSDMRRKTQLQVHEHRITCPYCRTGLVFNSLMSMILAARRTCPKCRKEFLIENGIAKRVGRARKP